MIQRLDENSFEAALPDLSEILHACVHAGASIGFILPFSHEDARAYWLDRILPDLQAGLLDLFVFLDRAAFWERSSLSPQQCQTNRIARMLPSY